MSTIERMFLADLENWNVHVEAELEGAVDADRLSHAIAVASAAHRMSRARVRGSDGDMPSWVVDDTCDAPSIAVVDACSKSDGQRQVSSLLATRIDLRRDAGFAALLLRGDESDRFVMVAHHAVTDAVGCAALLASIGEAYRHGRVDATPTTPLAAEVPVDPAEVMRAMMEPGRFGRPGHLRVTRTASGVHDLERIMTVPLDPPSAASRYFVTERIVAATLTTLGRWNRIIGGAPRTIGVAVPVNVRPISSRFEGVMNRSLPVPVLATPDELGDPSTLLAVVGGQLRAMANRGRLLDVFEALSQAPTVPPWARFQLCQAGIVASIPAPPSCDFGSDVRVVGLAGSPPTRPPTGLAIGFVGGTSPSLSARCSSVLVPPGFEDAFDAILRDELDHLVGSSSEESIR